MKISRPSYLGANIDWHNATHESELTAELSQTIGQLLTSALLQSPRASMAVSGGRTPIVLFETLSTLDLDWSKIDLTLADERWLDASHADSNEALVRKYLLQNNASRATFIPIKNGANNATEGQAECEKALNQVKQPFDVVVLGLGSDGHTASLFPCSGELALAMSADNPNKYIAITPKSAPYQRISLTRSVIANANNTILHITGQEKLNTLELAVNSNDESKMPIVAFLNQTMSIYWCP